jgi:hypothetical protein
VEDTDSKRTRSAIVAVHIRTFFTKSDPELEELLEKTEHKAKSNARDSLNKLHDWHE